MLVHQFIMLMAKGGYVSVNCHSNFHSPVPVVAKFCINNTQQIVIDHH